MFGWSKKTAVSKDELTNEAKKSESADVSKNDSKSTVHQSSPPKSIKKSPIGIGRYPPGRETSDTIESNHQRNLIVVGLTGSGKSSIISSLLQQRDDTREIAMGTMLPGTKTMAAYENNLWVDPILSPGKKYMLNLVDTIGLGDSETSTTDVIADILSQLPKTLQTIHRVVFVVKVDRLRIRMAEDFAMIFQFFEGLGMKKENLSLVLTFCDFLSTEFIESFLEELGKTFHKFNDELVQRTYVSFPRLQDLDIKNEYYPHLETYFKWKISASRQAIFEDIIKPDATPFNPLNAILSMPDNEYRQFRSIFEDGPAARGFFGRPVNAVLRVTTAFDKLRK